MVEAVLDDAERWDVSLPADRGTDGGPRQRQPSPTP
jgi:hypothetical protein